MWKAKVLTSGDPAVWEIQVTQYKVAVLFSAARFLLFIVFPVQVWEAGKRIEVEGFLRKYVSVVGAMSMLHQHIIR